jgi:hypothetical protein
MLLRPLSPPLRLWKQRLKSASKAKQSKAKQSKAKQSKAKQSKAKPAAVANRLNRREKLQHRSGNPQ